MRRLLVPLLGLDQDRNAILHAVQVARGLRAHVTVLFSGGHLSQLVSAEPPPNRKIKPALYTEARALLAEQAAAAREFFDTVVQENGLTVTDAPSDGAAGSIHFEAWRGPLEETVQEAAVLHDLVVFCRDHHDPTAEMMGLSAIKSALQSCGRPVLVVPEKLPDPFAASIAIAWNGSIEGAHAVSAALPWIAAARTVNVITIGTAKTSVDQGKRLQAYLAWHGVRASVHTPGPSDDRVGVRLLNAATALRADLLVLGGYTHSRVTQTFLGGVTHHVVSKAGLPVLLSR